jgi:repressor LexA
MGVGVIIRQHREQLGMTQDVLAAKVGISKPYLSNIETGRAKNPPADRILSALESALGFERGQLVKLAHWERASVDVREEHELLEQEVTKLRRVLRNLMSGRRNENGSIDLDALADQIKQAQADPAISPDSVAGPDGIDMPQPDNLRSIRGAKAIPIINNVAAGYPHHFTDLDYPPSVADEYLRCPDLHDPQAFGARVVGDSMEPMYHQGDIVVFSPNTPARSGDDCFVRFEADCSTTFKRCYQDNETSVRLQPLNNLYPANVYDRQQITGLWPALFRFEQLRR